MPRIIAIDYGKKRTGIAVTDPDQIIATALATIDSPDLLKFLKSYMAAEPVERILVGLPTNWDDSDTHGTAGARAAISLLQKHFPQIPVESVDERFTSRMAKDAILQMGLKKKDRRDKKLVDQTAAAIILQEYLQSHSG